MPFANYDAVGDSAQVLLDSSGGPTCIGPTANEVCTPLAGHCDAPILADTSKQKLEYRDSYFIMAHFSRFLPRGAVVVEANVENTTQDLLVGQKATNSPPLLLTAAVLDNGDDLELELIAVVQNTEDVHAPYQLAIGESWVVPVDSMTGRGIHTVRLKLPKQRGELP